MPKNQNCKNRFRFKKHCWKQELLKESGYKNTTARQIIFKILENANEHLSVEDIFNETEKTENKIDITTIYRNLEILEELEIILKSDFGDGKFRYEIKKQQYTNPHHYHLVCKNCGKIIDFTENANKIIECSKKIAEKFNFKIDEEIYQIRGFCNNCKK